jgi:nucleotide-binding universal stress UspA family protein
MKKILVPTDFSATAKNAAEYAIAFAKSIKAEVTFLHVFDIPIAVTDVSVVIVPSPQELEVVNVKAMNNYMNEVKSKHGESVVLSGEVKMGYVNEEIEHFVKHKKIDLIVMGITGAGKLSELLIGSNVTHVVKKIDCPVIVVPEKATFTQLKNIVFACDYNHVEESKAVDWLVDFVKLLDAKLMVINIGKHAEKRKVSKNLAVGLLEYIFENVNEPLEMPSTLDYSLHQRKDEDVIHGINRFVDMHKADLLVMIPRKHTLLFGLFHESNTKKMAFHSHVPLLMLHDKE